MPEALLRTFCAEWENLYWISDDDTKAKHTFCSDAKGFVDCKQAWWAFLSYADHWIVPILHVKGGAACIAEGWSPGCLA